MSILVVADTLKFQRNDFLKLVAVVTMFLDHVGVVMMSLPLGSAAYAVASFMRIVGRIAFPIFAYHLCVGYVNTSNIFMYFARLVIFAFISQVPFAFFYNVCSGGSLEPEGILYYFSNLNVFFTLILGLFAVALCDLLRLRTHNPLLNSVLQFLVVLSVCVVADSLKTDYGSYGILMIYLFYAVRYTPLVGFATQTILTLFYESGVQHYCVFGFFIIYLPFLFRKIILPVVKLPKMFFYIFYPVHILLIVAVRIFAFQSV